MAEGVVVYDLTVSKIWCTMCANKIKSAFEGQQGIQYVQVNVMAERVIISFDTNHITLDDIRKILEANNFFIVGSPRQINSDSNKQRIVRLFLPYCDFAEEEISLAIASLNEQYRGSIYDITSEERTFELEEGQILSISYQPLSIQAHQILKSLEEWGKQQTERDPIHNVSYKIIVYNELKEKFSKKNDQVEAVSFKSLVIALVISCVYLTFSMILPNFEFYHPVMLYPESQNVFSVYMVVLGLLTAYTLMTYGTQTYKNAWSLFIEYRMFNMDTLLTLGSLAALTMSAMLIVVYTIQNLEYDPGEDRMEQIMNIVHDYESAGLILTVITIGKYFEGKAKGAIIAMQQQIFPRQHLFKSSMITRVQVSNQDYDIDTQHDCEVSLLEKGDLILLNQNMKLLVDGVVVKGQVKAVDSVCYGWDDPFEACIGTRLKSGADIIEGFCIFQVEQVLESSMLFQIADQLNLAQSDRQDKEYGISALLQSLSQRFVLGVIITATLVLLTWIALIATDSVEIDQYCVWCFPFERAISILVASCPCALGLAVPSVVVITLNMALKSGILVKKNTIFEQISKVKCVVFDKTGTLFTKIDHIESFTYLSKNETEYCKNINKKPNDKTIEKVKQYQRHLMLSDPVDTKRLLTKECESEKQLKQSKIDYNESLILQDIWAIIGILEKDFKHPLANLLFKESVKRQIGRQSTFVLTEQPKLLKTGIVGSVTRTTDKVAFNCLIGNPKHLSSNGAIINEELEQYCIELEQKGKTIILMSIDGIPEIIMVLDNKSNLRPEARQIIRYLRQKLKKQVYILSGDSQKTVNAVGLYLGINEDNLIGETDAEGKRKLLETLKRNRQDVMMIGDGLNDVLSLQQACVGVSINAKSELNLVASDVIVLNENLWKIVALFQLMNTAIKVVYINLIWAFAYNVFMAPVAAGVFYSVGFSISPMISSASMSLSSIIVVLISNLMRFVNFDPSIDKSKHKVNASFTSETSFSQYDSYLAIESNNNSKTSKK